MNQNKFFEKFMDNLNKIDEYNLKNIIELMEKERRTFRNILDHLDEAIIVINSEELIFINKQAINILGGHDTIKTPVSLSKTKDLIRNHSLMEFMTGSLALDDFETEFSYGSQNTIYYEIEKISTVTDYSIFKIRDITEHKNLEFQLSNLESVQALNQLAAGIAHEIKNPMTAIDLHTQILKKGIKRGLVEVPGQVNKYVNIIDDEINRLNKILNDFLVSARKRELKLEFTDINYYLEEVIEVHQPEINKHDINLSVALDDKIPKIFIDPDYLKQAIINIIKNAIDAVKKSEIRTILIQTYYDSIKDLVAIKICDSGKGIDDDKLKKIFDPYYTSKEFGTGLGLTIVYKIVKEHGGEIMVDSSKTLSPPYKTSFTIHLPIEKGTRLLSQEDFSQD